MHGRSRRASEAVVTKLPSDRAWDIIAIARQQLTSMQISLNEELTLALQGKYYFTLSSLFIWLIQILIRQGWHCSCTGWCIIKNTAGLGAYCQDTWPLESSSVREYLRTRSHIIRKWTSSICATSPGCGDIATCTFNSTWSGFFIWDSKSFHFTIHLLLLFPKNPPEARVKNEQQRFLRSTLYRTIASDSNFWKKRRSSDEPPQPSAQAQPQAQTFDEVKENNKLEQIREEFYQTEKTYVSGLKIVVNVSAQYLSANI